MQRLGRNKTPISLECGQTDVPHYSMFSAVVHGRYHKGYVGVENGHCPICNLKQLTHIPEPSCLRCPIKDCLRCIVQVKVSSQCPRPTKDQICLKPKTTSLRDKRTAVVLCSSPTPQPPPIPCLPTLDPKCQNETRHAGQPSRKALRSSFWEDG